MINLSVTLLIRPILIFFLNLIGMMGAYLIIMSLWNGFTVNSVVLFITGLFTCWQAFLNIEHLKSETKILLNPKPNKI